MARDEERITMTSTQTRTLISTAEAAERIGVAEITLRLWRWRDNPHQPPYVRIGSHRIRYDVATLDQWRVNRTHKPGTKAGSKSRDPRRQQRRRGPR